MQQPRRRLSIISISLLLVFFMRTNSLHAPSPRTPRHNLATMLSSPALLGVAMLMHSHTGASTATAGMHVSVVPARTRAPLRRVSPHYVSFALDNAFVRDPTGISGVPLPPDATNSTRIDFQDALLNTVMPLVAGGFIRIGGTYTDFVHYYGRCSCSVYIDELRLWCCVCDTNA